jgi:molecular chaperone Hsp33
MLRNGDSPEDVLAHIFGSRFELLERVPVRFHCPCSRERVERAILLLGEAEVRGIIEQDRAKGFTEVTCEFCTTRYTIPIEQIEGIAANAAAGSSP